MLNVGNNELISFLKLETFSHDTSVLMLKQEDWRCSPANALLCILRAKAGKKEPGSYYDSEEVSPLKHFS